MTISFDVLNWSAWAPHLPNREAWQTFLRTGQGQELVAKRAEAKGIPAMQRRRCTPNARMFAETAFNACAEIGMTPAETELFFGTSNGEITALAALLKDLTVDEALSPTAFTNSVHHTPTGYFSIASKHRAVERTLSAFDDTFTCTWLDMQGFCLRHWPETVLLVVADEALPAPFDDMLEAPPFPYSVSLLLRPRRTAVAGSLRFERADGAADVISSDRPPIFDFLTWYDSQHPQLRLQSAFGAVAWQKQ